MGLLLRKEKQTPLVLLCIRPEASGSPGVAGKEKEGWRKMGKIKGNGERMGQEK